MAQREIDQSFISDISKILLMKRAWVYSKDKIRQGSKRSWDGGQIATFSGSLHLAVDQSRSGMMMMMMINICIKI